MLPNQMIMIYRISGDKINLQFYLHYSSFNTFYSLVTRNLTSKFSLFLTNIIIFCKLFLFMVMASLHNGLFFPLVLKQHRLNRWFHF